MADFGWSSSDPKFVSFPLCIEPEFDRAATHLTVLIITRPSAINLKVLESNVHQRAHSDWSSSTCRVK